ncbi:hypothetical protein ACHQM5_030553 [Ranunculus cassubicifolius]
MHLCEGPQQKHLSELVLFGVIKNKKNNNTTLILNRSSNNRRNIKKTCLGGNRKTRLGKESRLDNKTGNFGETLHHFWGMKQSLKESKPEIVFISETKTNSSQILSTIRYLEYENYFYMPPVGLAGGLLLIWNTNMDIQVLHHSKYIIHTKIKSKSGFGNWNASFYYGSPYQEEKEESWEELNKIAPTIDSPWMIIGDFNLILEQKEKGGRRFNHNKVAFATESIQNLGLMDIGFTCYRFTWTNKRLGDGNIKQRLDRVLVDPDWLDKFPKAILHHLTAIHSDHTPLLLDLNPKHKKNCYPFKFQAMWIRDESFQQITTNAWRRVKISNPTNTINLGLNPAKKAYKDWNKYAFGNIFQKIQYLNKALRRNQEKQPNRETEIERQNLTDQLDEALLREEIMWKQKSSERNVKEGDMNTSYFHTTTII